MSGGRKATSVGRGLPYPPPSYSTGLAMMAVTPVPAAPQVVCAERWIVRVLRRIARHEVQLPYLCGAVAPHNSAQGWQQHLCLRICIGNNVTAIVERGEGATAAAWRAHVGDHAGGPDEAVRGTRRRVGVERKQEAWRQVDGKRSITPFPLTLKIA